MQGSPARNGPRPLALTKGTGSFQNGTKAQGGPARYSRAKKGKSTEAEAKETKEAPERRRNRKEEGEYRRKERDSEIIDRMRERCIKEAEARDKEDERERTGDSARP